MSFFYAELMLVHYTMLIYSPSIIAAISQSTISAWPSYKLMLGRRDAEEPWVQNYR
uniref:Cyclin C-terminal domain-containing protein n=1 Tax=Triticum urartu TaxID=4572 RepID=A0A8R7UMK2_TRIUA